MELGAGAVRVLVVVVSAALLGSCTNSEEQPTAEPSAAKSSAAAATASAGCAATAEALLRAIDDVVQAHADQSAAEFVAGAGQTPTLGSQLELSPGDIDCEQGIAFALAFDDAEKIAHDSPGQVLAKFLLIGESGQRFTFGSDWGPDMPVEAPVPVGDPVSFDEARAAAGAAGSCREISEALALSTKAALDATARLSLPQFFGVEPGGQDINAFVVDAIKTAETSADEQGCTPAELWEVAIAAMSEIQTQGFGPHVAFGAFMQLEIYPRAYAALAG